MKSALDLTTDYFSLFGLEPRFSVDADALQQAFRDRQAEYHPDKVVNEDEQTRRQSAQAASLINEAYEKLRDPVSRAQYLLKLAGNETDFDRYTATDTDFLMQQLAYREEMENIPDESEPLDALDDFRGSMIHEMGELYERFSNALEKDDLEAARDVVSKLKFFQKLVRQLDDLEAKIEDESF
ncbi:MAG: Fe-S protein assembly co-chaperone HscB [bacterium]